MSRRSKRSGKAAVAPVRRPQPAVLTLPRIALTILALLLLGASTGHWQSFSLGNAGQLVLRFSGTTLVIPFIVVWLMPVVAAVLLLVLRRDGRLLVRRIGESRGHIAVSVLAVVCSSSPSCRRRRMAD